MLGKTSIYFLRSCASSGFIPYVHVTSICFHFMYSQIIALHVSAIITFRYITFWEWESFLHVNCLVQTPLLSLAYLLSLLSKPAYMFSAFSSNLCYLSSCALLSGLFSTLTVCWYLSQLLNVSFLGA